MVKGMTVIWVGVVMTQTQILQMMNARMYYLTTYEIRGSEFCSDFDAYTFYCAYAKGVGFVVRRDVCE